MAIIKDVTVKINNGTATLDAPVQFYEKDHDVELRFKLMDYKYKYDKDPQNILNSVDEDILEAYTTIVNPRGYELEQINGVVKNDTVIFRLDPTYTDELDELGTYKLQIHIKCTCSEFTIPPITFEVLQRLKGIKVVTDGEDEVDNSEILDNSSKFVSDETGKLIIEWKKGDMISSAKLNAMVDVINDAVDEEVIRQANEKERERKATNKIQELENTRVEYVNKFDTELDSFVDQVDASMSDYETRFNALTVSQQQDAEVIDARDGEQTLRARLERDIQKPLTIYEDVEGSYISCDSTEGYLRDIEIIGNTIQNQNDLADIRSVGDKVENQELYEIPVLSTGKNLFDTDSFIIVSKNTYGYIYLGSASSYTLSLKDKDTSVDINSIYLGFTNHGVDSIDGVMWSVNNGAVTRQNYTETVYKYLSIHPNNKETLEKLAQRFYIQIEEGAQATPYEPYQGDKITILSPVQLEKVEDVVDRIICKDGVWGVEKNITSFIFNGTEAWYNGDYPTTNHIVYRTVMSPRLKYVSQYHTKFICSFDGEKLAWFDIYSVKKDVQGAGYGDNGYFYIRVPNSITLETFKQDLSKNPVRLLGVTNQPQFIPLPYDQQIKLRTFANKTSIRLLTEIEPTLKASVPKSIGASVNSHAEQIDNLGKELEKINNLEENTASTITTESDFITIENTNNGYFSDIKLEGRTLVSLYNFEGEFELQNSNSSGQRVFTFYELYKRLITGNRYTFIFDFKDVVPPTLNTDDTMYYLTCRGDFYTGHQTSYPLNTKLVCCVEAGPSTESNSVALRIPNAAVLAGVKATITRVMVLEGDHTQNPPSYFEGLKSTGQEADDITITTTNAPMFFGKGGKK